MVFTQRLTQEQTMFGRKKAKKVEFDNAFKQLLKEDDKLRRDPMEFAPRNVQQQKLHEQTVTPFYPQTMESAVNAVKSFSELRTKEVDQVIRDVEDELTQLKERGQRLRDLFTAGTDEIEARAKVLRSVVSLADASFEDLEKRCKELYSGGTPDLRTHEDTTEKDIAELDLRTHEEVK